MLPARLLEGAVIVACCGRVRVSTARAGVRGGDRAPTGRARRAGRRKGWSHTSRRSSTFSTTVTAPTTLGTGVPPGRHGVVTQVMHDAQLGATIDIAFAPMLAGWDSRRRA
ncbi:MAG: hypothetical protein WKH64_13405 [Chloroflexia bacterium]